VVENKVHPIVGIVEGDAVLPANESETFTEPKEKGLQLPQQFPARFAGAKRGELNLK